MNRSDLIRHLEAHDLPEGWSETTVGQIADDISYGFTAKASSSETGPRYLRITDLQNGTVDWGSVPSCRIPEEKIQKYVLRRGDLVFARTGATTGKSYLVLSCPEAVFASYLIRVRPSQCVLPEFLAWFFQTASYWNQISENIAGSAQPNCNATKLASLNVPIPPLAEQRRIVAKLEDLLGKVDACQKRLAGIPVILKRFRQSVLAAACSGLLTADWREEDPHPKPAPPKLSEASHSTASELPETWLSVGVGLVIDNLKYGTAQKCGYEKEGVPVLRIPNIGEGVIDHSDMKYSLLPEKEFQQLRLNPGDVLIIRSNGSVSLVGKSALIRKPEKGFAYAGYLIRLRPNRSKVLPDYLTLALSSYDVRLQIEIPARSTSGVHNINSAEVRGLQISLPPLAEQKEIARRVEALFKFADQIEARYKKAQAHVDRVTQSILAKAFRGELVPTEAELAHREGRDYESASVLLERIGKAGGDGAAASTTAKANRIQERPNRAVGRRK